MTKDCQEMANRPTALLSHLNVWPILHGTVRFSGRCRFCLVTMDCCFPSLWRYDWAVDLLIGCPLDKSLSATAACGTKKREAGFQTGAMT